MKLKKRPKSTKSILKNQINSGNKRVSLKDIDLLPESKELINRIQQNYIYIINGDEAMINSRKIRDINNSSFNGNANFLGDSVKQINIQDNAKLDSALKELAEKINSISDEKEQDTASMHYETLVRSIEQNKPSRIESCLKALKNIVGVIASITTIAKQFGVVL